MGSGHITEVLHDLEEESKEKEILLKHYQKNNQLSKLIDSNKELETITKYISNTWNGFTDKTSTKFFEKVWNDRN